MAGALILLDSVTASTSATVTLGTTNWDNSYNVYMVTFDNVLPDTNDTHLDVRFTKTTDNSIDSSSNYYRSVNILKADTSFGTGHSSDANTFYLDYMGTAGQEQNNGVLYLFNFNNANEYSFITCETAERSETGACRSYVGSGMLKVTQATNGVSFHASSGNIASGEFKLYALRK
tara:strand:+ start:1553 stop:2077 length:525 start_codon:yes stop_codon:yes gene_type:complete